MDPPWLGVWETKQCFAVLLPSIPDELSPLVLPGAQGTAGEASQALGSGVTQLSQQKIFAPSVD